MRYRVQISFDIEEENDITGSDQQSLVDLAELFYQMVYECTDLTEIEIEVEQE